MLNSNFRCYQFHNNPFPRIGSHVVVLLKSDLDVRQTHLRGWFVEQKLPLNRSFRCDQIYNNNCYIFGHTSLFYLSPGNTKGGSITVLLTSCLIGLDQSVLQIKTKIVSCHAADSKPVKQEVNGTVILPPLVFPDSTNPPQVRVPAAQK